ncbi:MAG: hypothetical protein N2749_01760 [Clostridia bacterium]|nr:hypothetical protein [Clostridia bacterium]
MITKIRDGNIILIREQEDLESICTIMLYFAKRNSCTIISEYFGCILVADENTRLNDIELVFKLDEMTSVQKHLCDKCIPWLREVS